MSVKRLAPLVCLLAFAGAAHAQIELGKGQLSGSLESNSIYYVKDNGFRGGTTPEDRFGSNNYLKVDYSLGRFSAGIQVDAYLPVLQGYDFGSDYHKFNLASKYIRWTDESFEVLVGDIFDQYGNGLIYRSYEDRQLGFNNSVEGVRAVYNFNNYVEIKGMFGRPRLYTEYADSWVRGADLRISIADICNAESLQLSLEGSYINRFQRLYEQDGFNPENFGMGGNLDMLSGRVNFDWNGLSIHGEYVAKSKDLPTHIVDRAVRGDAWYLEASYNYRGFSFTGTFRQLHNMGTMLSLYATGTGNQLNYLPALTRQYTYMLANLEPYQVNSTGEIGGQIDVNYTLRSKTQRVRYWNFHGNFSTFYTLTPEQSASGNRELLWRDLNFDVERQWNKMWKTTLLFSYQEWNPSHGHDHRTYVANVLVADVTCKIDKKHSLRAELQYMFTGEQRNNYTGEYLGDWAAGLVEYNYAPHWSIYGSVMCQLEKSEANDYKPTTYYGAGVSYTKSRTRVQLSYGRNRAGYICSGGVCRYQPAYTGLNLMLTTSF